MVSFPTTLRHAAIAILSIAVLSLQSISNTNAQEEKNELPLRVMFVNQFPDEAIDLYWENHAYSNDHPERRRLEARIAPRGGWHASETFFGHGKSSACLMCVCVLFDIEHILCVQTKRADYNILFLFIS